MMAAAFDADPGNEILSAEEEYRMLHPSGIKLRGYPDRIERIGDGSCVVVDFKTKRSTEHKKDDIDTCLQVVIYAWMCEQAGIPVSSCEYRYLRKRLAVTCSFDDRRKAELQKSLRRSNPRCRRMIFLGTNPRKPVNTARWRISAASRGK